jgi:hypothetical protein
MWSSEFPCLGKILAQIIVPVDRRDHRCEGPMVKCFVGVGTHLPILQDNFLHSEIARLMDSSGVVVLLWDRSEVDSPAQH